MSQKGKPMAITIPEKKTELRYLIFTLDGKEHSISKEDYEALRHSLTDKDELPRSLYGSVTANEGTDSETVVLMKNLCAIGKRIREVS